VRENTERWRELAKQAETEQDPERFLKIIRELNELLAKKEHRLEQQEKGNPKL
jgi:hypothetical protein